MAKNPFLTAHYKKTALTKTTAFRIQGVYSSVHSRLQTRLDALQMINPSDSLRKVYLENFIKEAKSAYDEAAQQLRALYVENAEKAGQLAIDAGNKLSKETGLSIKGAYAYVPKKEVQNIISGGLYGGKWSLSQSIWKSNAKTKSDIERIVAAGLTENRSVYDIAKDLEKYVDPTARKPWDWSKVYPGTSQKIDYNAQRLARTMIQHSFQSSLVQSQKDNPFCKGILWHSAGHERTCELCDERDGQVFPVNDLPFDHPNGMCYFEPALDDMNAIADRLADWTVGGNDPAIDRYVTRSLGLPLSSKTAAKAISNARKESSPKTVAKPTSVTKKLPKKEKFKTPTDDRAAAEKWVRSMAEKQAYTAKQLSAFEQYMMESDAINGMLRGELDYWDKQVAKILSNSMTEYKFEDAMFRGIDGRLLGLKGNETAEEAIQKLVGRTRIEKGFMSTTRSIKVAEEFSLRAAYDEMSTSSNVVLVLQAKGQKVSYLKSGLGEMIIDKGSRMTFTDVVKKKGKFYVYAVMG